MGQDAMIAVMQAQVRCSYPYYQTVTSYRRSCMKSSGKATFGSGLRAPGCPAHSAQAGIPAVRAIAQRIKQTPRDAVAVVNGHSTPASYACGTEF